MMAYHVKLRYTFLVRNKKLFLSLKVSNLWVKRRLGKASYAFKQTKEDNFL